MYFHGVDRENFISIAFATLATTFQSSTWGLLLAVCCSRFLYKNCKGVPAHIVKTYMGR